MTINDETHLSSFNLSEVLMTYDLFMVQTVGYNALSNSAD